MATATGFAAEFIARTKHARESAGMTQTDMATLLGIKQGVYKQYEVRSPLPHRFVAAFCIATHVSEHWLFTGHQRRQAAE
jgi:DNA-binding XRE family transcriptional regulator